MLSQGREHESVRLRSRAASLNLVTEELGEQGITISAAALCGDFRTASYEAPDTREVSSSECHGESLILSADCSHSRVKEIQ